MFPMEIYLNFDAASLREIASIMNIYLINFLLSVI